MQAVWFKVVQLCLGKQPPFWCLPWRGRRVKAWQGVAALSSLSLMCPFPTTHSCTQTCTCRHTYKCAHIHVNTHMHKHTHAHHVYTHRHMHMNTHTHAHMWNSSWLRHKAPTFLPCGFKGSSLVLSSLPCIGYNKPRTVVNSHAKNSPGSSLTRGLIFFSSSSFL